MRVLAVTIEIALQILFPLFLAIFFAKKYGAPWRVFFTGLLFFIVSQLVETPFRVLVGIGGRWIGLYGSILLLSLIAGVGEELSRYVAFRFIPVFKQGLNWGRATMYGIGHGGLESILAGISLLSLTLIFYLASPKTLAQIPRQLIVGLEGVPAYLFILGGVERVMTLIIQMGLSLVVALAFVRNNLRYLFLAILIHFVIDGSSISLFNLTKSPLITEGLVLVFALAMLWWIVWFRQNIETIKTED